MSQLSLAVALGVMKGISEYVSADFDAIGITPEQYKHCTDSIPWTKNSRRQVTITLEALLHGTLDQLGLGRFAVPAEYVAAIVATFVSPCNRLVACMWLAEAGKTGGRAMDLAAQGIQAQQIDTATPSQLFALVCMLSDPTYNSEGRKVFESRLDNRLKKAVAQ